MLSAHLVKKDPKCLFNYSLPERISGLLGLFYDFVLHVGCFHIELERNSITFNYEEAVKRVVNIIVALALNLISISTNGKLGKFFMIVLPAS